jgi:CHAT domain-containing protein/SIR2-like protein
MRSSAIPRCACRSGRARARPPERFSEGAISTRRSDLGAQSGINPARARIDARGRLRDHDAAHPWAGLDRSGRSARGIEEANVPKPCAELEIAFHSESLVSQKTGTYVAELRFAQPGSEIVRPPVWAPVTFDFARLLGAQHTPAVYGDLLAGFLRDPPERRDLFRYACDAAALASYDLRVRLFIGANASDLHRLRWELLSDPESGAPLFTSSRRPFSRLLGTCDLRPVRLRPRDQLRALIVIANPSDLHRYCPNGGTPLPPIDVAGELEAARLGLGSLDPTELASGGTATLDGMLSRLRSGQGCDILFLACHGAMHDGKPLLWLEKPDGTADVIVGRDFVQRLCELPVLPRLIVLVSCQSAGDGSVELVHAIGPSLATEGIPAVVAMQGNISMETARTFLRVLFENMQEDGRIDRAVAIARGAVRGHPDWWTPVLFLRIASGSIWYVPGSGDREFDKWPALLGCIENGKTLPILGTGMLESLVGDMRELTRSWAEAHGFPGASIQDEEDMPHVAQFLSVVQADEYLRNTLFVDGLRGRITERLARILGQQGTKSRVKDATPLDELVRRCGREQRCHEAREPHRVLASLPLPIYITTNPDDLLHDALIEAGKAPQREFCRWTSRADFLPGIYEREPGFEPTAARPLVYYLFGHLSDPVSIVLTIDDYLDHLLAVAQDPELVPKLVRAALAKRALLFLGFRSDDWNFRALFRYIVRQPGSEARRRFAHVAAQLEPDEGRLAAPERVRQYLEQYFGHESVTIYWGTVERFAADIDARYSGTSAKGE